VIGGSTLDRVVDSDYAVVHRVFAVHPQVNKPRRGHAKNFTAPGN